MKVGRYEVRGEIARGGMGVVYRARDPGGRELAVKLLLAGRLAQPVVRQRFLREARALTQLDHPHVVRVHEVGEHDGCPFLALDFVAGETLKARLEQVGPLPIERACAIVAKLARALHHIHQQGLLHRDVKPDNVVLDRDGEPVLVDFGLTRDLQPGEQTALSKSGSFLGSPGYWPPEQAGGRLRELGPHSDVYGLGATLVALLTGFPPHGEPANLIQAVTLALMPAPPPSSRRPDVSAALDAVCLRALEVDPAKRYRSAEALAVALEQLGDPPPSQPAVARTLALAVVGVGVALALGVLVVRAGGPANGSEGARPQAATQAGPATPAEAPIQPDAASQPEATTSADAPDLAGAASERHLQTARMHLMRARQLALSDRRVEALAQYEAALELAPDLVEGVFGRALMVAEGDPARALADLDRVVAREPRHTKARSFRATLRARGGDLDGAIADYEATLAIDDLDPELAEVVRVRLATVLRLRDDPRLQVPLEAAEPLARAERLAAAGDVVAARALLDELLGRFPECAPAYRARGLLRVAQDELGPGLRDLARFTRLDPTDLEVRRAADRAIAQQVARLRGPTPIGQVFQRGLALARQGALEDAVEALTEVLRLDPDMPVVYDARANCYEGLGAYRPMADDCTQSLALEPQARRTYLRRSRARIGLGDLRGAIADCDTALAIDPEFADAHARRGEARALQGDHAGARVDLERALDLDPSLAVAQRLLAELPADD